MDSVFLNCEVLEMNIKKYIVEHLFLSEAYLKRKVQEHTLFLNDLEYAKEEWGRYI